MSKSDQIQRNRVQIYIDAAKEYLVEGATEDAIANTLNALDSLLDELYGEQPLED